MMDSSKGGVGSIKSVLDKQCESMRIDALSNVDSGFAVEMFDDNFIVFISHDVHCRSSSNLQNTCILC